MRVSIIFARENDDILEVVEESVGNDVLKRLYEDYGWEEDELYTQLHEVVMY